MNLCIACGLFRQEAPLERNMALGVRIRTAEATMVPKCCDYDTMRGPRREQEWREDRKGGGWRLEVDGARYHKELRIAASRNFSVELPGERSE